MQATEWLTSTLEDDEHLWLVRTMADGELRGWQACTTSGLVRVLNAQAYAAFIDEDPDVIAVYRLTPGAPAPVRIKYSPDMSMVYRVAVLSWHCPAEGKRLSWTVHTRVYGA